jgi:uncharacterized repeat protein (TIGR01451 family)
MTFRFKIIGTMMLIFLMVMLAIVATSFTIRLLWEGFNPRASKLPVVLPTTATATSLAVATETPSTTPSPTATAREPTSTVTQAPTLIPTSVPTGTPTPTPVPPVAPTPTAVIVTSDLVVTHTANILTAMPGDVVTYTLVISNVGEHVVGRVMLTDTLPDHTVFANASDGGTETVSGSGVVRWPKFALAAGESITRVVAATIDRPLPGGVNAVTNVATVAAADAIDPAPDDNIHAYTICAYNPPSNWRDYAVQESDTLFSLAQRYGTTVDAVVSYNCLRSAWLKEGQRIHLPPTLVSTPASVLNPPTLIRPVGDASFTGWNADVVFEWSAASRPLEADEYYVLLLNHASGTSMVWTKTPYADNLRWLSGRGPSIQWQVVIAHAQSEDPTRAQEDPTGKEVSGYSEMGLFSWHPGSDGSSGPAPTPDPGSGPSDP